MIDSAKRIAFGVSIGMALIFAPLLFMRAANPLPCEHGAMNAPLYDYLGATLDSRSSASARCRRRSRATLSCSTPKPSAPQPRNRRATWRATSGPRRTRGRWNGCCSTIPMRCSRSARAAILADEHPRSNDAKAELVRAIDSAKQAWTEHRVENRRDYR